MSNNTDAENNVISIQNQRCRMAYRPLSHNERVKINYALDSRGSQIEARKALLDSYEWHGKKDDRPAFDVFLESENEFQEYLKNIDPNEKKMSDMTPEEVMQKINALGEGGDDCANTKYELFFGDNQKLGKFAKKQRIKFFNSRAYRLYMLQFDLAEGRISNIDDVNEVKALYEKASLEQGLISEEKAAVIRAMPTPAFN